MPRYRITIEYDGTPFLGWQRQAQGPTVQGALEEALLRFSGETASVRGAGRTDAGVHALGQVAHFDLAKELGAVPRARGAELPSASGAGRGRRVRAAADDFDARYSATARHYRYRILSRRAPPALERDRVWWLPDRARCRRHARGGAGARRATRLHDLPRRPVPGEFAAAHARPAGRVALRRRDRHRGLGALVPAQPGALDGRQPEAGRRGQVAAARSCARRSRRATAPPAARWRRRAGFTWRASTTARPLTPTAELAPDDD